MVKWFQIEVSLLGSYLLIAYKNQFKKLLQDFILDDKIVKWSRRESKTTLSFCDLLFI